MVPPAGLPRVSSITDVIIQLPERGVWGCAHTALPYPAGVNSSPGPGKVALQDCLEPHFHF